MEQKKRIQSISIIALLAIMLILMGRLFLPYMSVILWSAVCYIVLSPSYNRLVRRMNPSKRFYNAKRQLLAGVYALGTVLVLSGVVFFISFQLIGQGRGFLEGAKSFISNNPHFFQSPGAGLAISQVVERASLGTVNLSQIDIKAEVLSFLSTYSESIVGISRALLKNVGGFLISLVFMCFTLYFFFLDAKYLADLVIKAIPIAPQSSKRILLKFRDVTKSLFMGFFLVAFYQAVAAFAIFTLFRVDGALLFSVLILFCSFIPMVGCALVWLPLGLGILVSGNTVSALVFLALCAVFISFLDNFLRPFFLKDRVKIHPLLIFFSILGGLKVFGINGILLGPLVIILFFTIVDISLEEEQHDHGIKDLEPSGESDGSDGANG
jgi:predicted PurR-regulated permease PerM